jgi:hypothetical protein
VYITVHSKKKKKKLECEYKEIAADRADLIPDLTHCHASTYKLPGIRRELLEADENNQVQILNKCPEIFIKLNGVAVLALLDTGSIINALSLEWFSQNKTQLKPYAEFSVHNTNVISALGNKSKLIKQQILCEIEVNNKIYEHVFLVVPNLQRDCILGIQFMADTNCEIDLRNQMLRLHKDTQQHSIPIQQLDIDHKHDNSTVARIQDKLAEINNIDHHHLQQLKDILIDNQEIFREEPGRIRTYEHSFQITDNTPFFQKGWPVPVKYQEAVETELQRMLKWGVIERCNSPYVSPLVTVIKKNGSVRLCLDARRINSVTVPAYDGPQPIPEILARCGRVKYMSTIDLSTSFWQVGLREDCRDYTAFMYKGKCYRFTVTPFGLSTSLASLIRGLDTALSEEIKKNLIIYVDDCLCYSTTIEQHLANLTSLFTEFKNANITINLDKTQFFRDEIEYLGYKLTTKGIETVPSKISAIQNFPVPKNQKQLKGFLGLTNYYQKFTKDYAETTLPLLRLLQKNHKFIWTPELTDCFNKVKALFLNTIILQYPEPNKRFYLQCDASDYAYGGVLFQLNEEGEEGVIGFVSRTFKGAECNYCTTEKELLSIVRCLEKFRIYILGKPLTVRTDNKALSFMKRYHLNNSRITPWILAIQEYNFEIEHCSGKTI